MLIARYINNYEGYDQFIPFVIEENDDLENQKGLILNKGWIPHERKRFWSRLS